MVSEKAHIQFTVPDDWQMPSHPMVDDIVLKKAAKYYGFALFVFYLTLHFDERLDGVGMKGEPAQDCYFLTVAKERRQEVRDSLVAIGINIIE